MKKSFRSSPRALPMFLAGAGAGFLLLGLKQYRRSLRRIDFRGKSVVISGGSRGLGLELARQLSREGARLALLARDPAELERAREQLVLAGGDVLTLPCDVKSRQEVEEAVAAVIDFRGGVDVLINVAGVIQVGPYENMELEDYQESVEVHAWGPLHLIRAVLPHMKAKGAGRIVNISSIGGLVAVPHLLPYTMGKFALTGLSDGFRAELAKDGILVTTVAPGLMRTGSHVNALFRGQHRKEFAWFSISAANPLLSTSGRHAAQKIIEACRYGDPRLVITFPARLLQAMNALFPGLVAFGAAVGGRMLPAAVEPEENELRSGWESGSAVAPSLATAPADNMIERNNEERPAQS